MGRIIRLSESKFKNIIKTIVEQNLTHKNNELNELTYDEFKNSERLQSLRDAINKNKIVGVAFVKKDGSVRPMCFRKFIKAYVSSDEPKSEKQSSMNETHNQISVIDLNLYNKTLRESGSSEIASKTAWRKINLENVLGFIAGANFVDLRGPEDNNILERYGENVYNSLTKSMIKVIEHNQQENEQIATENTGEMENTDGLLEIDIKNVVKKIIKDEFLLS